MESTARRIRLRERWWGHTARAVLTSQRQATVAAAFDEVAQLHEAIGRWQNLALGLWLVADVHVAEAVTLTCVCRAAELCTSTAVFTEPVCEPNMHCDFSSASSSSRVRR